MRKRLTMMFAAMGVGVPLSLAALSLTALSLAGCQPAMEEGDPQDQPAAENHGHDDHGDHDHAAHTQTNGEYAEELAKLPPADRELAARQKVCPVSGEPLGSMGVPTKVTVQGRDVLLCCQGCEGQLKENPEKYLAKLPSP